MIQTKLKSNKNFNIIKQHLFFLAKIEIKRIYSLLIKKISRMQILKEQILF
ncbi:unnamed protein product [Paramecium sonneborni]|uniref:Uncharacterized protein n=1 Tax=Paramecium sonneborni TaxID=65129 RepID=A0A8S1M293_9CILI|nr:unnamed protein product [Paramecium sonneborni]